MTLAITNPTSAAGARLQLRAAAFGGVAWNGFGIVQFAQSVSSTSESLMAMGLDPAQAMTMSSYALWMTAAFAVGVPGGVAGSAVLLMRRRLAIPVLAVSLLAYPGLYLGDIPDGVFAAMGPGQVLLLSAVVLIVPGLL
jgi:hypothetical protein